MVPTFAGYSSFCGAAASPSSSRVLPTAMCPEPEPYLLLKSQGTPQVSLSWPVMQAGDSVPMNSMPTQVVPAYLQTPAAASGGQPWALLQQGH